MPFGKANSSRVFCMWTSAWCESFKTHFQNQYTRKIFLASYVDDFFGGPFRSESLEKDKQIASLMLQNLIEIGDVTNTRLNLKKCRGPARRMDILGIVFDSVKKSCFLGPSKISKYCVRLSSLQKTNSVTSKKLQKIIGCLVFAAWVLPYGRPFISHLSHCLDHKDLTKKVSLDLVGLVACDIWIILLKKNYGLPFSFILGRLPRKKEEWFFDASKHYGYGGVCGNLFFEVSHKTLMSFLDSTYRKMFEDLFIAYRELLAALFAFQVFAKYGKSKLIRINSDNTNTVSWLNKGRCPKNMGFLLLSAIEFYKFKHGLKIKAFYIKSSHNTSADALSRGRIPPWLTKRGKKLKVNVEKILDLLSNPQLFWRKTRNPF